MKIESEKLLERKLRVKLEKLGGYCLKWPATHNSGVPDRICLLPGGIIFFAEIKTTGEKPDPLQKIWHKKLRKAGFEVYVVDTSDQIEQIIKKYGKSRNNV